MDKATRPGVTDAGSSMCVGRFSPSSVNCLSSDYLLPGLLCLGLVLALALDVCLQGKHGLDCTDWDQILGDKRKTKHSDAFI